MSCARATMSASRRAKVAMIVGITPVQVRVCAFPPDVAGTAWVVARGLRPRAEADALGPGEKSVSAEPERARPEPPGTCPERRRRRPDPAWIGSKTLAPRLEIRRMRPDWAPMSRQPTALRPHLFRMRPDSRRMRPEARRTRPDLRRMRPDPRQRRRASWWLTPSWTGGYAVGPGACYSLTFALVGPEQPVRARSGCEGPLFLTTTRLVRNCSDGITAWGETNYRGARFT